MNDVNNQSRRRLRYAAPFVAALLLGVLLAADQSLVHWHALINWPWWFGALEEFGSKWVNTIIAPAAILFALLCHRRSLRHLLLTLPIQMIFTQGIKSLIGRVRPIHGADALLFAPFSEANVSFPSGHAAMAWTIVFVFAFQRSRSTALWIVLALFVCWARLQTYAHFPSDLLAGMMIGWMFASAMGISYRPWIEEGVMAAWRRRADPRPWLLIGMWVAAIAVPIGLAMVVGRRVSAVDEPTASAQIAILYKDVLGRPADAPGLAAYAKRRLDGEPLIGIERDMLGSDESRKRLMALEPEQRVRWLYQLLVYREPTAAEIARDQPLVEDLSRQRGRLGLLVMRLTWPGS